MDCKSCAAVSTIGTKGAELQLWRSSLFRFPLLVPGLLSGLIFTLSIPKFDYYFLAWLCLLPLLLARHWLPTAQHFSLGLISGIAWGGGRAYWISEPLQLYATLSLLTGFVAGSLTVIWPWKMNKYLLGDGGEAALRNCKKILVGYQWDLPAQDQQLLLAVLLMLAGAGLVPILEFFAGNKPKPEKLPRE